MKINKEIEFETLHSNKHRIYLLCGIVCVVVLMVTLIVTTSKAKYRVTESMPLIQGTINFSPSDLNLMAVYLNKNGETISSDKVPHIGYTLNTEQSLCEVNDVKDESIEIVYENGLLNFNGLGNKGTKCTAYFDLIPDSENPVINNINGNYTDTSITITVDASDNIGIYYYYFQIDEEEEIQLEENTYTFDNLNSGQSYTINIRVEDAAGNIAETSQEMTAGLKGKDVILASANAPTGQTTDWTNNGTGTTYYYTGDSDEVNNWVQFAGFYWRIMRINGDGSIRMIYQGTSANTTGTGTQIGTSAFNISPNNNMYVGYMYGSSSSDYNTTHTNTNSSTIKGILDTWYSINLAEDADYIDGNAGFCGDRRISSGTGVGSNSTNYQPYTRLSGSNPSLSCDTNDVYTAKESSTGNKALTYPIGLISADEAMFAGMPYVGSSSNFNNYLNTGQNYWTMSPASYSYSWASVFVVAADYGALTSTYVHESYGVRPVINLRSDVSITGTGTVNDPFKVVGA